MTNCKSCKKKNQQKGSRFTQVLPKTNAYFSYYNFWCVLSCVTSQIAL